MRMTPGKRPALASWYASVRPMLSNVAASSTVPEGDGTCVVIAPPSVTCRIVRHAYGRRSPGSGADNKSGDLGDSFCPVAIGGVVDAEQLGEPAKALALGVIERDRPVQEVAYESV